MAHFSQLDANNLVTQVVVINNSDILDVDGNESEEVGVSFCQSLFGEDTVWVQTSYNGSIRKNYAGIGYTYDADRDAFIPPKHYESWILNEETCRWEPPVAYPDDGGDYTWNETDQQWDLANV